MYYIRWALIHFLPAEQYAIQTGQHPAVTTEDNIARYREQMERMGFHTTGHVKSGPVILLITNGLSGHFSRCSIAFTALFAIKRVPFHIG